MLSSPARARPSAEGDAGVTDASQGEDGPMGGGRGEEPLGADETLHLRVDALRADQTMQLRVPPPPEPPAPVGGRAERRRDARSAGRERVAPARAALGAVVRLLGPLAPYARRIAPYAR